MWLRRDEARAVTALALHSDRFSSIILSALMPKPSHVLLIFTLIFGSILFAVRFGGGGSADRRIGGWRGPW